MKYLIFSDLHGSFSDLEAVLKYFAIHRCEKIICLGDVLYHGPRNDLPSGYNPKEVVKLLNSYSDKIICLKGNCDSEVDRMVLDFKLRNHYRIKNMYFTHGQHLKFKSNIFRRCVFYGHTHIMEYEKKGFTHYINPGSISLPKRDGKSFIIMENKNIKFYDLNNNLIKEVNI